MSNPEGGPKFPESDEIPKSSNITKQELEAWEAQGLTWAQIQEKQEERRRKYYEHHPIKEKTSVEEYKGLKVGQKLEGLRSPIELSEGTKFWEQIVSSPLGDLRYSESLRDGTTWWTTTDGTVKIQIGGEATVLTILAEE